ncbi:hypothetical protein QLL95_gp0750 [Cotonvirus japonicus]|uniref:Uncharacterized protein n=1 Tax=Cotonvirus japonicus TaxID=2811091 RepID=A0ABM7NT95_9VIRU|nr:hypothetical protein QLL95_gp0750 [Cotonvirus japonicus]BCS83373.1 hypothetical protein [Cotonvirus japonicus]
MVRCFGEGYCIKPKADYGYYKPYKCEYNCKLVACCSCQQKYMPQWILDKKHGICDDCRRVRHNESMMAKLFRKN